ncbi:MAG: biotin--[acetyl-CoA-carboxylase] ligase [Acidimicrobiia bacterium]|nr:MAG: biotin--[acetyl-CoA-carboxylase] ligase [Acidimicrobiia bacterium]
MDAAATRFTEVRWFASIDSTNRYLLDEAARGAPEGVVAVADVQTAGRGRLGRTWTSPPGASLLVSVLLRPRLPPGRRHLVTLAAGVAAVDAVRELAGAPAALKWPNDVVVHDRKLAGILAEASGDAVVVGMGCNVHWDEPPDELRGIATACNLCGTRPVTRERLLEAWLAAYDARLRDLDGVADAAARRSATLGRRVRALLAHETVEGVAERLTEDGHLVIATAGGAEREIAAGDVVHLR